jgi:subtilisin
VRWSGPIPKTPAWALAVLSLIALALASTGAAFAAPSDRGPDVDRLSDRYIVVFRGSVADVQGETDQRERRHGFRARFLYRRAVKGFSAKLSRPQVERLESDPEVAFVSPDRKVRAVAALAPGDSAPTGVSRIGAASGTEVRSPSGSNVAVLDTGVDLDHPDLSASAGKNCVGSGPPEDDHGHGTHVAGSIAARNNGSGLVGVAPDTNVFAAKVLDSRGNGTWSQIICGIDWATATRRDADAANDIAVANMSVGGSGSPVKDCASTTDAMHKAICNSTQAGVNYVVAAGNSGWDFDYAPVPDVPAAYPEVLTVAAASDSDGKPGATGGAPACRSGEQDDRYASFSNYAKTSGGEHHTVAAPGVCIASTWIGNGQNTISGTSMASPHIAGAVALCLNEGGASGPCAGLTTDQVVQRLREDAKRRTEADSGFGFTGDPLRPVTGKYFGYLSSMPPVVPDTTAPSVSSVSPAENATGVAANGNVSVTFSEVMDRAATEAAFSLAPTGGAKVAGSFSWSANTMTFNPSSDLASGAGYTATVGSGAKDKAGNALPAAKSWAFTTKPLTAVTAFPNATSILSGKLRSGTYSRLGADDNSYYQVNSTSSSTRTSDWYARFYSVTNALSNLKVTYKGKNSSTCTQRVYVYRFNGSTGWVQLDARSVGTTEAEVANLSPSGPSADYVSGTSGDGEVRVRVRCTRSSPSFYASGDLLKIGYDRP